jgi:hypothetical protein
VLSTGTSGGSCNTTTDASGTVTGGSCTDGRNTASATCDGGGGDGHCVSSTGAGSCDIARRRDQGDAAGTAPSSVAP